MTQSNPKVMPNFSDRRNPFHYVTALSVLVKMEIDINRVDILAVGEYENYRGEIRSQKPKPGTMLTTDTRIVFEVGYPSAIDYMPYQMFYGLEGITPRSGEWEHQARAFMAPFDAAVVRHNALTTYQALKFSFSTADLTYLLRFMKLLDFVPWETTSDIDEASFWAAALPGFQFWAGNRSYVERVLEYLFGYDFRIIENDENEYTIPQRLQPRLGSASSSVGKTLVAGRSFRERDSAYELQVRGVPPHEVNGLMPGKSRRQKLEWVLGVCMPNHLHCRIVVKVDKSTTVLGDARGRSYLGYSIFV